MQDVFCDLDFLEFDFSNDRDYNELLKIFCGDERLAKYWHFKRIVE